MTSGAASRRGNAAGRSRQKCHCAGGGVCAIRQRAAAGELAGPPTTVRRRRARRARIVPIARCVAWRPRAVRTAGPRARGTAGAPARVVVRAFAQPRASLSGRPHARPSHPTSSRKTHSLIVPHVRPRRAWPPNTTVREGASSPRGREKREARDLSSPGQQGRVRAAAARITLSSYRGRAGRAAHDEATQECAGPTL